MNKSIEAVNAVHLPFVTSAMEAWSSSIVEMLVPSDLVNDCSIVEIVDYSGEIIICLMLYGERKGKEDDIPYDGGGTKNKITDLSSESLWLYGQNTFAEVPLEFNTSKGLFDSKWKPFYIGTGNTRKCPSCRGRGVIKCRKCKGRGSYESGFIGSDKKTWEACSCGNGYNECGRCSGYGTIQDAIKCSTRYLTHSESTLLYDGLDFEGLSSKSTSSMIEKSKGKVLFDEVVDFPFEEMISLLTGGVDATEYQKLVSIIEKKYIEAVDGMDVNLKSDIHSIYDSFGILLKEMPNPAQTNRVLENEIVPVRSRIRIAERKVLRVKYIYQEKPYVLWVYGKDGTVYASAKPQEFTSKAKIALAITVILLMLGIIGIIVVSMNS